MKKRIVGLVVSGLMALFLVLASCAPQVTEEKKEAVTEKKETVTEKKETVTEKKEVVTEKGVEMVVDTLGRLVPKPQYGGWLTLVAPTDPSQGFSRSSLFRIGYDTEYLNGITGEDLLIKDWLKGPAGTGEWEGRNNMYNPPELMTGNLAESWEIIPPDILKFKIRKGVHFQDKAPVWGAELTAEDVVYTFLARFTRTGSTAPRMYPILSNMRGPAESIYIDPADRRTVVFKLEPGKMGDAWERIADHENIVPAALGPIEGEGFGDWQGVVGTGPLILTDYVRGSSLTWERNPNYWQKDVFHPQNQLPYLDGVKVLIIADLSTQQAALRTGKIDILRDVEAEDWESLMRTNPELLWVEVQPIGANAIGVRHDVAPFNDVRVRRAMMMAINKDEILRDYYRGKAIKFYWPSGTAPEHKLAYRPLEEMPKSVQELFEYHPDKAKRLLAEAGYPNGFTTTLTVSSAAEKNIDLASIVAAYWAKVGVTLKIDIKEPAVESAMKSAFTHPNGIFDGGSLGPETRKFIHVRAGSTLNYGKINEPLIEETFQAISAAYFDWNEVARIQREATPKLHDLALKMWLPSPILYNMWWPWLKGYTGELEPDYVGPTGPYKLVKVGKYVWIDQKLKKAMGR